MRVKRSRSGRSSSIGESGVVTSMIDSLPDPRSVRTPIAPAPVAMSSRLSDSTTVRIQKPIENQTPRRQVRRRILMVGSPVKEKNLEVGRSEEGQIGDFLEKCYHCKGKIPNDKEVFMYSDLRAFCTAECRQIQIDKDKIREILAAARARSSSASSRAGKQLGMKRPNDHVEC